MCAHVCVHMHVCMCSHTYGPALLTVPMDLTTCRLERTGLRRRRRNLLCSGMATRQGEDIVHAKLRPAMLRLLYYAIIDLTSSVHNIHVSVCGI